MKFNKICIFAEATTTNGRYLIKFKKGAFHSMRTVQPVYFRMYPRNPTVSPYYDTLDFFNLCIFYCSQYQFFNGQLTILPPFTPNQHMLKTQAHRSPNNEAWEIYAECVRDVMAKHGGYIKNETTVKEKFLFEDIMERRKDTITVNGMRYTYKGHHGSCKKVD